MDRELLIKMKYGCLGALTPIILNLIIVDPHTVLSDITPLVIVGYILRVVGLCLAACIVIWLNSDEVKPVKLFQLGIAAPAVLTGMLNGAVLAKKIEQDPKAPAIVSRQTDGSNWFTSSAYAQPAASVPGVDDCRRPRSLSASQQILRGLTGSSPDDQYFVVVGSTATPENAFAIVKAWNTHPSIAGKHQARVCAPVPGWEPRYRVVVGEDLNYLDATKLKNDVAKTGFVDGPWVWNPLERR